jgi:predicted O-methyltransferase YrrM
MNKVVRNLFGPLWKHLPHAAPPAPAKPVAASDFPADFDESTKTICRTVRPYTMTSPERINALVGAVRYVATNRIEGAIVECGVWRGGSMMAVALALREIGDVNRELYLYDTYAGMPPPEDVDCAIDGLRAKERFAQAQTSADPAHWSRCYSSLDEVRRNVFGTDYPPDSIHFVAGKVEETIPGDAPADIALLRLDTDWYESTRHEMVHLYPRLRPGGVLIIDDYGHWQGARKAIDEFIAERKLKLLLCRVDYTGRIAIKLPED